MVCLRHTCYKQWWGWEGVSPRMDSETTCCACLVLGSAQFCAVLYPLWKLFIGLGPPTSVILNKQELSYQLIRSKSLAFYLGSHQQQDCVGVLMEVINWTIEHGACSLSYH